MKIEKMGSCRHSLMDGIYSWMEKAYLKGKKLKIKEKKLKLTFRRNPVNFILKKIVHPN